MSEGHSFDGLWCKVSECECCGLGYLEAVRPRASYFTSLSFVSSIKWGTQMPPFGTVLEPKEGIGAECLAQCQNKEKNATSLINPWLLKSEWVSILGPCWPSPFPFLSLISCLLPSGLSVAPAKFPT